MRMVSILIRTKNEELYLEKTLRSIVSQDFHNLEIIIIDSGSTDKTIEIAKKYTDKVIQIDPSSFTYGYSLNVGLSFAIGEIIVVLSGHACPLDSTWLSRLVMRLGNPKVAAVSSKHIAWSGQRINLSRLLLQYIYFLPFLHSNGIFIFHNASAAYQGSLLRKYPFDEKIKASEDYLWAITMIKKGYKIEFEPKSIVLHSHSEKILDYFKRRYFVSISMITIHLRAIFLYER